VPSVSIRARSVLAADTDYASPIVAVSGARDARIRLDPGVAFDDPSLLITVTVELSLDGGTTWSSSTRGTIIGGARGKDGLMPSVGFGLVNRNGAVLLPAGARLRLTYRQSKAISIGLNAETT